MAVLSLHCCMWAFFSCGEFLLFRYSNVSDSS